MLTIGYAVLFHHESSVQILRIGEPNPPPADAPSHRIVHRRVCAPKHAHRTFASHTRTLAALVAPRDEQERDVRARACTHQLRNLSVRWEINDVTGALQSAQRNAGSSRVRACVRFFGGGAAHPPPIIRTEG